MRINRVVVPIAALAIVAGSSSLALAQAGERHHSKPSQTSERSRDNGSARQQDNGSRSGGNRERSSGDQRAERRGNRDNQSQDQDRQRAQAQQPRQEAQPAQQAQPQREDRANRDRSSSNRDSQRNADSARRDGGTGRNDNRTSGGSGNSYDRNGRGGSSGRSNNQNDNRGRTNGYNGGSSYRNDRNDNRGHYSDRYQGNWSRNYNGYSRGYYAPRLITRGYSSRHYYGSGARLSLYFGIGSGYRYGSIYDGRVYGYRHSVPTYGNYVSYGDVRLRDAPRDAEVYVDGYYAGIVDDFDGLFQRLTLEVGAHEIEIAARGFDSQFFDVYVDPYNTVDVHADMLR